MNQAGESSSLNLNMDLENKTAVIEQMSQIQFFSGTDPCYSIDRFYKDFESWAKWLNWEEKDKFFILNKKLRGKAAEIVEIHEGRITTSEQIFEILKKRLTVEISADERLEKLKKFKQTPEMPVADFISLAHKKAVAAAKAHSCTRNNVEEAAEEWLLSALKNNVLPQYRPQILRSDPKTVAQFTEIAKIEEATWRATNGSGLHENFHVSTSEHSEKMVELLENMTKRLQDLSTKVEKLEGEKVNGNERKNFEEVTCFSCGRKGHMARFCRQNSQPGQNYSTSHVHSRGREFGGYRNAHMNQGNYRGNFNQRGGFSNRANFRGNTSRGRGYQNNSHNLN